jgi:hypothetical protein
MKYDNDLIEMGRCISPGAVLNSPDRMHSVIRSTTPFRSFEAKWPQIGGGLPAGTGRNFLSVYRGVNK